MMHRTLEHVIVTIHSGTRDNYWCLTAFLNISNLKEEKETPIIHQNIKNIQTVHKQPTQPRIFMWKNPWPSGDLNPGPLRCRASALPTELPGSGNPSSTFQRRMEQHKLNQTGTYTHPHPHTQKDLLSNNPPNAFQVRGIKIMLNPDVWYIL